MENRGHAVRVRNSRHQDITPSRVEPGFLVNDDSIQTDLGLSAQYLNDIDHPAPLDNPGTYDQTSSHDF